MSSSLVFIQGVSFLSETLALNAIKQLANFDFAHIPTLN